MVKALKDQESLHGSEGLEHVPQAEPDSERDAQQVFEHPGSGLDPQPFQSDKTEGTRQKVKQFAT